MMNQENKFISLLNIGYWKFIYDNIDLDQLIKDIYHYQKLHPNTVNKSNQKGWQSEDNIINNYNFEYIASYLDAICCMIFPDPNRYLNSMWINISPFGGYNTIHTHPNSLLSGVFYIKIPPNSGNINLHPNHLDLGQYENYSPKEKEILIFPSFLPHSVQPNSSQEDRISISFNYG